MPFVNVPMLYDNDLNFYSGGKLMSIPTDSLVQGTRALPETPPISGVVGSIPLVTLLAVKTVSQDMLYLDMTLAEYNAAVAAALVSPNAEQTATYTIGTDKPVSAEISATELHNATINSISVSGIDVDIRTVAYSQTATEGVLTFPSTLTGGDVVSILYYKN